eukprot:3407660-Rhodomonas_salina.1
MVDAYVCGHAAADVGGASPIYRRICYTISSTDTGATRTVELCAEMMLTMLVPVPYPHRQRLGGQTIHRIRCAKFGTDRGSATRRSLMCRGRDTTR